MSSGPVKVHNLPGGRPIVQAATPDRSPFNPAQQINFYGELAANPSENRAFAAFAQDEAPTPTGGYAKWQVIDRPQRIGLTVFQGYDPFQLSVPVRFTVFDQDGSWRDDSRAGERVEIDIAALEWMAGRETGVKKSQATITGASPLVYVSSTDASGNAIPLIPFHFQATGSGVPRQLKTNGSTAFVITDLAWDATPSRNRLGYRVRQDVTVTLTQFLETGLPTSAALRTGTPAKGKATVVHSAAGADTALLIAVKVGAKDQYKTAHAIQKTNPKLKLRSRTQKIKHGTAVKVPAL